MYFFSVTTDIIQIRVRLAVPDKRVFKSTRRRKAFKNVLFMQYRVRESSISKLLEAIGETKTKIYCQANVRVCRTCVLAEPMTTKVGLTKDGSQAKRLKFSKKKVKVSTNLEQIFQYKIISLNSKPKSTQQKVTCALKISGFAWWVLLPLQNRLTMSSRSFNVAP